MRNIERQAFCGETEILFISMAHIAPRGIRLPTFQVSVLRLRALGRFWAGMVAGGAEERGYRRRVSGGAAPGKCPWLHGYLASPRSPFIVSSRRLGGWNQGRLPDCTSGAQFCSQVLLLAVFTPLWKYVTTAAVGERWCFLISNYAFNFIDIEQIQPLSPSLSTG